MSLERSEQSAANEDAVKALVGLLGGVAGLVDRNIHFPDLAHVLNADPNDDLSGLRLLASRMTFSGFSAMMSREDQAEPLLRPHEVKKWLILKRQVKETESGLTPVKGDKSHLTRAGIAIATGTEPRSLTEVYRQFSPTGELNESLIGDIALNIVAEYRELDRP